MPCDVRVLIVAAVAACASAGASAPPEPLVDPCALEGVPRIVAVGDVHGDYGAFTRILRAAGVIDARDRWAGRDTHLVQTGDVLDRGPESRRVLDLLRRLERDAPKAGGRVLPLVGNHEVMRLLGDLRNVHPSEIDAFRTSHSSDVRDMMRVPPETPLGLVEMLKAFSAKGEYGRWIRNGVAAARINGILFVHGGVSARVAPLRCEGINSGIRADLTTGFERMQAAPLDSLAMSEDGPLWYRGLAREPEEMFEPEVEKILAAVGARAIVIGHTVSETGRIHPRFHGRVVQVDTGMLSTVYKGGRGSALEIVGDRWTAIYEDERVGLPHGNRENSRPDAASAVADLTRQPAGSGAAR